MNEMMSTEIKDLMQALAIAQGQIEGASKDSVNPFFKSKYADLASVWEACRTPLSKNGLSVIQFPQTMGEDLCLVTILGHSSGQWIKTHSALPIQKNDAQEMGKCLSYFRRYALAAIVGVYQEDDDAESIASHSDKKRETKVTPLSKETKKDTLTECQLAEVKKLLNGDKKLHDDVVAQCGKKSIPDVKEIDFDKLLDLIDEIKGDKSCAKSN